LGFKELFSIPEATFYAILNEKLLDSDIYSIINDLVE
jgi:hypothetical protein